MWLDWNKRSNGGPLGHLANQQGFWQWFLQFLSVFYIHKSCSIYPSSFFGKYIDRHGRSWAVRLLPILTPPWVLPKPFSVPDIMIMRMTSYQINRLTFFLGFCWQQTKKNNEKLHEALFLRSFRCFCCQPQCFRDLQSETGTRKELAERASIFRQRFVIGSFESFTLLWMSALFILRSELQWMPTGARLAACWHWCFLSSLWWRCMTCRGIDLAGLATFPSKKFSICLKSVQQGQLENARAKWIRCRRAEVLQRQGSFHCCWSASLFGIQMLQKWHWHDAE